MVISLRVSILLLLSIACSPNNLVKESHEKKANKGYEIIASDADLREAFELMSKARLNAQFGKLDSALILYDKAIELDNTYYAPHLDKRAIYIRMKQYKKALQESEMVLQKRPDLAEEWTYTGMLYEWLDDSKTAFKYYRKSIEMYDHRISDPEKKDDSEVNRGKRVISFILLGEDAKGRAELRKLKDENLDLTAYDEIIKIEKHEFINRWFEMD